MNDGWDIGGRGNWRGKVVLLVSLFALAASACSGTTPDAHDVDESNERTENRWNAEDSDLPGKPIPGKKARIKEGMHIRPGIDFVELTGRESEDNIEFENYNQRAYVTGSAREKFEDVQASDVLMGDGFIYQLDGPPVNTSRGVKLDLKAFSLLNVIWGDFELNYPEDFNAPGSQGERPDPPPPYRKRRQRIALPWQDFTFASLWNFSIEADLSGSFSMGVDPPDFQGTFEGRIPLVAESYNCNNPSRVKAGCLWGHCAINKKYCVEKIRVTSSMAVEPDLTMNAQFGAQYEDKLTEPIVENTDIGSVPIPSTPLAIGVEFGVKYVGLLRLFAGIQASVGLSGRAEATVGMQYTDHDGIEPVTDFNLTNTNKELSYSTKAKLLLRHSVRGGLIWTLNPSATPPGLTFQLELLETSLEARWDSIYTCHAAGQSAKPSSVAGSCLRSKLMFGPYIEPDLTLRAELNLAGFTVGYAQDFLPDDYSISWRPVTFAGPAVDGNGQYCLANLSDADAVQGCGQDLNVPEPERPDFGSDDSSGPSAPTFKIEASWFAKTDVDLEVKTPNGIHFGPGHTQKAGSGTYPFDVCGGAIPCTGPDHKNAEAVVYQPASDAPSGTYELRVTNDDGQRPAKVLLQLRKEGRLFDSETVRLSGTSGDSSGWIRLKK